MGKFNGKDATVWMRSIRAHTYEGKPQDVGAVYLAHEEMVETIENLRFAVRDTPPPRAVRTTSADLIQPTVPLQHGNVVEAMKVTSVAPTPAPPAPATPVKPPKVKRQKST